MCCLVSPTSCSHTHYVAAFPLLHEIVTKNRAQNLKLKAKKRAFLEIKKCGCEVHIVYLDNSKCSLIAKHTHCVSKNKEANTHKKHDVKILKLEKSEVF